MYRSYPGARTPPPGDLNTYRTGGTKYDDEVDRHADRRYVERLHEPTAGALTTGRAYTLGPK